MIGVHAIVCMTFITCQIMFLPENHINTLNHEMYPRLKLYLLSHTLTDMFFIHTED